MKKSAIITRRQALVTGFAGMGALLFQPLASVNYAARWKDEKGEIHTTPFPKIMASGISMQVTSTTGRKVVTINAGMGLSP